MTEINEKAEFKAGRLQVIHHLSTMFIGQFRNGLDFNNYLPETNEVRLVDMDKFLFTVKEIELLLFSKRNALMPQLNRKTFLIDRLNETKAFILVDLEARSHYRVTFIFENKFCHNLAIFVSFGCFEFRTKTDWTGLCQLLDQSRQRAVKLLIFSIFSVFRGQLLR